MKLKWLECPTKIFDPLWCSKFLTSSCNLGAIHIIEDASSLLTSFCRNWGIIMLWPLNNALMDYCVQSQHLLKFNPCHNVIPCLLLYMYCQSLKSHPGIQVPSPSVPPLVSLWCLWCPDSRAGLQTFARWVYLTFLVWQQTLARVVLAGMHVCVIGFSGCTHTSICGNKECW